MSQENGTRWVKMKVVCFTFNFNLSFVGTAMNWVAKYSELKKQYESAVQQKESVQQLSGALREKTIKLDALSKEYEALQKETVAFVRMSHSVKFKM